MTRVRTLDDPEPLEDELAVLEVRVLIPFDNRAEALQFGATLAADIETTATERGHKPELVEMAVGKEQG